MAIVVFALVVSDDGSNGDWVFSFFGHLSKETICVSHRIYEVVLSQFVKFHSGVHASQLFSIQLSDYLQRKRIENSSRQKNNIITISHPK